MDVATLLHTRAADLHLEPGEAERLASELDERVVQAVLTALVRYEDALLELSR
ncbi:MAG: hypothetical protein JOZ46_10920 [Candidatus Dormibacteraeota bacterium]|nr:hypothetical protein [Candidatus Dormibacteraeota bacterium]MBV9526312.1 hypothetical protein [Candidatus Dormibacteraeota bacterium]